MKQIVITRKYADSLELDLVDDDEQVGRVRLSWDESLEVAVERVDESSTGPVEVSVA